MTVTRVRHMNEIFPPEVEYEHERRRRGKVIKPQGSKTRERKMPADDVCDQEVDTIIERLAEADEQDRRDAEERDLRRDLPTIPDLGGKQVAVQPIWGWADVMY